MWIITGNTDQHRPTDLSSTGVSLLISHKMFLTVESGTTLRSGGVIKNNVNNKDERCS